MTKDEIFEAAAQIIRVKGYHATSMQDIAAAVDLRKASLYHHVKRKQDILVGLLDKALDILISNLEDVIKQDVPAEEKFRLGMRSYLNTLTENIELASVLLLEYRSLESEKQKGHIARRDKYEKYWQEILQEGIDQGVFEFREPKIAVKAILGVANWTIMWFNPNGRLTATEIADLSADLLLSGLFERNGED